MRRTQHLNSDTNALYQGVPQQFIKTVADSAVPERLASPGTFCAMFIAVGNSDFNTANTSTLFIGPSDTDDANVLPIEPGERIWFTAPAGQKFDLGELYVDVGTNGDGLSVIYWA